MNRPATKAIISSLSRCLHTGRRQHEVFRDFVSVTEATLRMLPAHAASVRKTGAMAEDDEKTAAVWDQLRKHYKRPEFDQFSAALRALVDSTDEYHDVLGDTYMEFAYPNPGTGQYFTPFDLAAAMARMTWGDGEILYDRLNEASKEAGLDALFRFSPQTPKSSEYFVKRFGQAFIPHFKPITVCDPCCGSGVMFLASASALPRWATSMGLVRFYGVDIDALCCQMATVNLMLYGLNGFSIKCALACTEGELATLPEPRRAMVVEAQTEERNGNHARVEEIKREVRFADNGQSLMLI